MLKIFKIISRFDYDFVPEVIDKSGHLLKILKDCKEDVWDTIGERQRSRTVYASYNDEKEFRSISISPNNLVLNYENIKSYTPEYIINSRFYSEADSIISEIFDIFSIKKIERAGIRYYAMRDISEKIILAENESPEDVHEKEFQLYKSKVQQKINTTVISSIEKTLGTLTDLGIQIEGKNKDGIKYHLVFGPSSVNDLSRILTMLDSKKVDKASYFSYTIDMDLYETNLDFTTNSFKRWSKTKLEKLINFNNQLSKVI